MKIVVLDGYTENPGDLSWDALKELGEVTVYDRTSYEESPLIAERIGDAEIVVMNKTPISKETIDKCGNIKLIAVLATGYNVVDYIYAKREGDPRSKRSYLWNTDRRTVCPWITPGDLLPITDIMTKLSKPENGKIMKTGVTGIIP